MVSPVVLTSSAGTSASPEGLHPRLGGADLSFSQEPQDSAWCPKDRHCLLLKLSFSLSADSVSLQWVH